MPRPNRVILEGGIFHVYNWIGRGEPVFSDDNEAAAFTDLLSEVKQRDGWTVFAWCLMSNHYHIALRCGAVPLHRSLKSLQQGVTRGFNARHQVVGPFWQGRYRAKLVENQRYLNGLLAYIHLNPVAAGVVDDPAEFRWSGHHEILGRKRKTITDVDEVLVLFGGTRRTARGRYVRALEGTVAESWLGENPGRLPWWRLGRPRHDDHDSRRPDSTVAVIDELGRSTGLERPAFGTEKFVAEGAVILGTPIEDLRSKIRAPAVVRVRELLTALGVERYGLRVKEMAGALNKSSEAASRMVSRGIEKRRTDEEFRATYEELDRLMSGVSVQPPAKMEL